MSAASQLSLYGRRYQITVATTATADNPVRNIITVTDSDLEPGALRATFEIEQRAFQVYWTAEICIYNLDQATTDLLLGQQVQNLEVTVSAGYVNGPYGVIWSGPVFQPLFERVGTIDFKITLHCILGLIEGSRNFINKTLAGEITQLQLMQQIADSAFTPIKLSSVSPKLSTKKLPRGKPVFGSPMKYFTQVAEDNNMQCWLDKKGLSMSYLNDDDIPSQPSIVFSPPALPSSRVAGNPVSSFSNGVIVGTPQQTQYGVYFRALLNPNVQITRPYTVVKIDHSQIRKQKAVLGQVPTLLDQDGIYIVAGVRFSGDTRGGNNWYVEVDGFTRSVAKTQLLQAILANTNH